MAGPACLGYPWAVTQDKRALFEKMRRDLGKTLGHLDYSHRKAIGLLEKANLGEDELEGLDGFAFRFSRASDLAIRQLLRFKVLEKDPAFRGGPIDTLNEAEKYGWIRSASDWARIRELRNVTVHEYGEAELRVLYAELVRLAPTVLELKALLS